MMVPGGTEAICHWTTTTTTTATREVPDAGHYRHPRSRVVAAAGVHESVVLGRVLLAWNDPNLNEKAIDPPALGGYQEEKYNDPNQIP